MIKSWDDVLAELVDEPEFKSSIEEKGFFFYDLNFP
jgi:hypothetical protein